MAAKGERGWQSEKTLVECMRYMLDNEIATDVCFEVGPPDGTTVNIRAHKYMLMSRSPVFEAMFSSGMTECSNDGANATVRVEDIEAETLKNLLLYIYSEDVSVNTENAVSLMYAASKYMLPKLVAECGKLLSEGLSSDNVIQVLERSTLFDDKDLKSKCLQLIVHNPRAVLTGTEILSASLQTMETILNMDKIPIKEIIIYEACIAWAKHQLQIRQSLEATTDQQIREMLGDLLYKIRFPIMDLLKFAEISEENNKLLTGEEKASVYYFLATKKIGSQMTFSTEYRGRCEEVWIDRSRQCVARNVASTSHPSVVDAINLTTDRDILLTGIGLYTGFNGSGYDVDVEILPFRNSLFKKRVTVPATGDLNQFKVSFDEPISIGAGTLYSIKAFAHGSIGHYAHVCQAVCTTEDVTFTFSSHPEHYSPTNETVGQIPRFYFCCY